MWRHDVSTDTVAPELKPLLRELDDAKITVDGVEIDPPHHLLHSWDSRHGARDAVNVIKQRYESTVSCSLQSEDSDPDAREYHIHLTHPIVSVASCWPFEEGDVIGSWVVDKYTRDKSDVDIDQVVLRRDGDAYDIIATDQGGAWAVSVVNNHYHKAMEDGIVTDFDRALDAMGVLAHIYIDEP